MKYLDRLLKDERYDLYDYTRVLFGGDIPEFIEKYLELPIFKALDGKGQFCGADYSKLFNIRCWYTRLNHSVNCAGIVWRLTKDKKKTICALCHDLGTPCFAHTIDFLLKDYENQKSSEKDINDLLRDSKEFLKCLEEDGITLQEVNDPMLYSLVDIERPGLCADRFEGIIHTAYIRINDYDLEMVKKVVNDITIGINSDSKEEISFKSVEGAKLFFQMMISYAYDLQSNESSYSMQFIADVLDMAIKDGLIKLEDLYIMEERDVVKLLDKYAVWHDFRNLETLEESDTLPDMYYVEAEVKKRYAIPLVATKNGFWRLTDVDKEAQGKLDEFFAYGLPKYVYSTKIRKIGG